MLKRGGQAAFRDDRVFAEPCWGRTLEGLKKTFSSSTRPSTCIASSCPRGQGSIVAGARQGSGRPDSAREISRVPRSGSRPADPGAGAFPQGAAGGTASAQHLPVGSEVLIRHFPHAGISRVCTRVAVQRFADLWGLILPRHFDDMATIRPSLTMLPLSSTF